MTEQKKYDAPLEEAVVIVTSVELQKQTDTWKLFRIKGTVNDKDRYFKCFSPLKSDKSLQVTDLMAGLGNPFKLMFTRDKYTDAQGIERTSSNVKLIYKHDPNQSQLAPSVPRAPPKMAAQTSVEQTHSPQLRTFFEAIQSSQELMDYCNSASAFAALYKENHNDYELPPVSDDGLNQLYTAFKKFLGVA